MRNTLKSGSFRILIYRNQDRYVGICYEAGFVTEGETIEEVQSHIMHGMVAMLKTVKNNKLSEKAINQKPTLKYRLLFFLLPIIAAFTRWLEISFFTKPITPLLLANA